MGTPRGGAGCNGVKGRTPQRLPSMRRSWQFPNPNGRPSAKSASGQKPGRHPFGGIWGDQKNPKLPSRIDSPMPSTKLPTPLVVPACATQLVVHRLETLSERSWTRFVSVSKSSNCLVLSTLRGQWHIIPVVWYHKKEQ